jgi:hypothetical protein
MMIASCFYQPYTWNAKRFFYSLDRLSIGMNISFIPILNNLVEFYPAEFFRYEYGLPYHYGGWYEFSRTNFSCLYDYIVDPNNYTRSDPNVHGSKILFLEWIYYFLNVNEIENRINSNKAKIPYKRYVENEFVKDHFLNPKTESIVRFYDMTSLDKPDDYLNSLRSLTNFRGLHNAKPSIKHGLNHKEHLRRHHLFKRFNKWRSVNEGSIPNYSATKSKYLAATMKLIKGLEDAPTQYIFPRSFIKDFKNIDNRDQKNNLYIPPKTKTLPSCLGYIRKVIDTTLSSLDINRWIVGSSPFILKSFFKRSRATYLISNHNLYENFDERLIDVPSYYELFCSNKKLFLIELMSRYSICPITYHEVFDSRRIEEFKFLLNPIEVIFPSMKDYWRSFLSKNKKHKAEIEIILSSLNIRNDLELKDHLDTMDYLFKKMKESPTIQIPISDDSGDIIEVLNRLNENTLLEQIFEGRDLADLINENELAIEFDEGNTLAEFEVDEEDRTPTPTLDDLLAEEEEDRVESSHSIRSENEIRRFGRERSDILFESKRPK